MLRDRLSDVKFVPKLIPMLKMHAMSLGHGKTIVGAYLVGSRATLPNTPYF